MDSLYTILQYGTPNLDDKVFENVQNIRQNRKYYHECHGKLKCKINSMKSHPSRVKDQRGVFVEDTLSPLLFIIAIIRLNNLLRKCTLCNKFPK